MIRSRWFKSSRGKAASAAAVLAVLGTSVVIVGASPATAASGDGSLTVQVIRDVAGTGSYNSLIDLPLSGVTVKVTDEFGTSVSLTTDADGKAVLPANDAHLTGGSYRVDVVNPDPTHMWPALIKAANPATTPSTTVFSSNNEFVDLSGGKNVTMTTGFWFPHDYCQSNPMVANACQAAIYAHGNPNPQTGPHTTVFTTPYEGDNSSNPSGGSFGTTGYSDSTNVAGFKAESDSTRTGSVYGIAYNRQTKMIFASAYAKRNVAFGPAGPGGIYVINPATGATTTFTTVPNAAPSADLAAPGFGHDTLPSTNDISKDEDIAFAPKVGKESLGAMVISDDYTKLYVVNEYDKLIYVYDATQPSAAAPLATIDISANPGCAAADDWRPMGLGTNQGVLYVGGVCSGEVEAAAASPENPYPGTLKAIVSTYDQNSFAPLNGGSPILDQSLNFNKGDNQGPNSVCAGTYGGWMAWNDAAWCAGTNAITMSQPMLGKILVEENGNLDLGFRDRFGDQTGKNLAMPLADVNHTGGATNYIRFDSGGPVAEGDTNLACLDPTTQLYVMDVNGGCGIAAVTAGTPVNHYYNVQGMSPHPRSNFAGMTMSYLEPGLITDHVDATSTYNSQGLSVVARGGAPAKDPFNQLIVEGSYPSTSTGVKNGTTDGNGTSFGKAQGLADMDVLCDLAPVQIGNRVWYNTAADGHQNAGEKPVVGATINLYDKTGALVATTKTNDKGEYSFDSLTTKGLTAATDYVIKMDNPADYASGGPLEGWSLSKTTSGPDGNPGSTGSDGYPAISMKTGGAGQNNDDYDFGFRQVPPTPPSPPTPQVPQIHIVKFDGRLAGPANPEGTLGHDNNVANPTVYQDQGNGTTGDQAVKMVVTNTGTAPLIDVNVSDQTLSAPAMTGLTCDFSALGGPATGTTWAGVFKPGASFPCRGTVNLKAGQTHGDQINVVGTQADPNTGQAVKGASGNSVTVSDADRYYAKLGLAQTPSIHIVKFDGRLAGPVNPAGTLGHDDNAKSPTVYQDRNNGTTGDQPVKMVVTNTGTAPLIDVNVSDQTLSAPAMTGLTCDFSALGGPATGTTWAGVFKPGASFPCTGTVNLKAGQTHGDQINVVGTQADPNTGLPVKDASGNPVTVSDADRYYAKTSASVPMAGGSVLPDTGGPGLGWLLGGSGALIAGGALMKGGRRKMVR